MSGSLSWSLFLPNLGAVIILLYLSAPPLLAKRKDDRVVLKNGDQITGEIKRIERGMLYFKPGYALDDIQIDWTQVERLESKDYFTVGLTDGAVYTGLIKKEPPSSEETNDFTISTTGNVVERKRAEVVTLQSMEKSRWNQMKGSIDYGFSYASGNSQTQSSFAADAEYHGERNWVIGKASSTYNGQSDGTSTQRETLSGSDPGHLPRRRMAVSWWSCSSSSQQELDLRTTLGGALGKNTGSNRQNQLRNSRWCGSQSGTLLAQFHRGPDCHQCRGTGGPFLFAFPLQGVRFDKQREDLSQHYPGGSSSIEF